MTTFAELGLSQPILDALAHLGYERPTPIQEQAIPALREGRDVVGQAQTGTGKTAAFGLPMLEFIDPEQPEVQALVLTPTRELCIQVTQALRAYGERRGAEVVAVFGGAPIPDVAARGLDITGVSHVINFDIPNSPDIYVHRIGRTGRAGEAGRAITLITPRQRRELEAIERHANTEIDRWAPGDGRPRPERRERETRRPRHTKPHSRDGVPYAKLIVGAGRSDGLEPADVVEAVVDNTHLENDDVPHG